MAGDGLDGSWHCRFTLRYHLVLATKYRRPAINDAVLETIRTVAEQVFAAHGCRILAMNHDRDHLHVMFSATPKTDLVRLIGSLKTATSRTVRKQHATWLSRFYWKPVFWNRSYYIGTVGDTTAEIVEMYIKNQGKKDSGTPKSLDLLTPP